MAGSIRFFKYTDDAGNSYSVKVDESNGEATVGGAALMLSRTAAHPYAPCVLQKRFCYAYVTATPAIKRRFYIGNPAAVIQILSGGAFLANIYPAAADGTPTQVAWTVTAYRGEKNSPPPALNTTGGDTGLTDGDAPLDQGGGL